MSFQPYKKLVLVVLDGFGIATASHGNAISLAQPTTLNYLADHFPATTLQASGPAVGLPWGEVGNSEVGHLNLGAGRIVAQDLSRITLSIEDRSFFSNPALLTAVNHVRQHGSRLHLIGLVSPGGVHSYDEHLYALLGLCKEARLEQVFIHMFTDGRDTPPQIALDTLEQLEQRIRRINVGRIATVTGRFYAMDRAEHWNLTQMTYEAMVLGLGPTAVSARAAIEQNYDRHIYDEMIPPTVILQADGRPAVIADHDAVIHFNFRPDRAWQLAQSLIDPGFGKFAVKPLSDICLVTMTEYAADLQAQIAFPPQTVANGFAEVISQRGMRQFHVAESEKYAHVSVFFNGGAIHPFPGEDRQIVTSPASNYQNYQDIPQMSAEQVVDTVLARIKSNYGFFLVNFANPDMVGHTGNIAASIVAIQTVDHCLKRLVERCLAEDIGLLITADHGNIEELLDIRSGGVDKGHSTNPVPLILVGSQFQRHQPKEGGILALASILPVGVLSDVAPTMLALLGIPRPSEMIGISLLSQLQDQIGRS